MMPIDFPIFWLYLMKVIVLHTKLQIYLFITIHPSLFFSYKNNFHISRKETNLYVSLKINIYSI